MLWNLTRWWDAAVKCCRAASLPVHVVSFIVVEEFQQQMVLCVALPVNNTVQPHTNNFLLHEVVVLLVQNVFQVIKTLEREYDESSHVTQKSDGFDLLMRKKKQDGPQEQ